MTRDIFTYLQSYSVDPLAINRLIVSSFLRSFGISEVRNAFLKDYVIRESDKDLKNFKEFSELHLFSSIEDLIEVFEFVISPQDKIITGAIYTPNKIRSYIVNECLNEVENCNEIKLCDPACGCGGFLYTAAKCLHDISGRTYSEIFRDNIYGLDIQNFSVERATILLSLLAVIEGEDKDVFEFNLFNGNALNFDWSQSILNFEGFDFLVGNPPYVCSRNIDPDSRELIDNWSVCSTGHPDLYIPFFELGLSFLKNEGQLGYITMNTFFKSINGRALREYLTKFDNTIIDFGGHQVFDSKSTYTCICLIKKQPSNTIKYIKLNDVAELDKTLAFDTIDIIELDHFNGWNLQEIDLLNRIEKTGTPLGEKFKTRNGIATLKNNIYIFTPVQEDEHHYYLQNGNLYPIEKSICTDIINPNKFTKIKTVEKIKQKVIFPYRYNEDGIEIIDEIELEKKYPKTYKYLCDKKGLLAERDKGKGNYEKWYAYGRNQSLEKMSYKLFFPHISSESPNFVINEEESLLFYNGLALIGNDRTELEIMQKLMSSRLFWYYITRSSKPYGSGYFSLSRNYIKKFGIPNLSSDQVDFLLKTTDPETINKFVDETYGVDTTFVS